MYRNTTTKKWTLIGTVSGQGYDCRTDRVDKIEESTNGLWNKVSSHMTWLERTMADLGEPTCRNS